MKAIAFIILILILAIFYIQVKKFKKGNSEVPTIPKKIEKVMNKFDNNEDGVIELVKKIKEAFTDKTLEEAFTDIKDIRYGKIGCNNCPNGESNNKWIKLARINLNGSWNAKGFTLEIYPRIRWSSSARQTIVCLVRNAQKDLEEPYLSLTTHNEAQADTRTFKDVKAIRVSGTGVNNNIVEVWGQFATTWGDIVYSMFYLYGIETRDEIVLNKSPMSNTIPTGTNWGLVEINNPDFEQRWNQYGVNKIVKNANNGNTAYTLQGIQNATGQGSYWFVNSATRNDDGGKNTATIRNDGGDMRVQGATPWNQDKGIIVQANTGNVGINTKNPRTNLEVNGNLRVNGSITLGNTVLRPEGNYLWIEKEDGRKIMLLTPDWDKIQIYRNSNGQRPYFYVNKHGGFGWW